VYYKGRNTEVIVDVLVEGKLPAESLLIYKRSAHLQMIQTVKRDEPYRSLKHVDPKSLWDFPGHESIRQDWFKHILMRDGGMCDMIVTAVLAEDAQTGRSPFIQYVSGDLIVPAGVHLVVGESGMLWSINPNIITSETLVEWSNVVDLKLRKVK
jgi:hypothetical protein